MRLSEFALGGMFEPPPAMYADIVKWTDATLAGHYLARAETHISRVQAILSKKPTDPIKDVEDYLGVCSREILRLVKTDSVIRTSKDPSRWDT